MHLDVTAVGPAERLQRLAESRSVPLSLRIVRAPHKYRDLPYRPVLLRARRERPYSYRAAEKRDEAAALHSITSSARASKVMSARRASIRFFTSGAIGRASIAFKSFAKSEICAFSAASFRARRLASSQLDLYRPHPQGRQTR
jgi:hypothetical protein